MTDNSRPSPVPIQYRAAIAAEHALCWPVARFCTGCDPPAPGDYLARVEVRAGDRVVMTRRSFEHWDGARWTYLGDADLGVYVVTGWVAVAD